jgi:hypothetical protein
VFREATVKVVIMRNVVFAAVIGVLVVGASPLSAPVAKADISLECHPGCWGAIAASLSTGQDLRCD